MKLNQGLIRGLRNGEIAVENNGTKEQLREVLKAAFPKDETEVDGIEKYYFKIKSFFKNRKWLWDCNDRTNLPIVPISDFYGQPDLFTGWAKDDIFTKFMFYFKDDVAKFGFDASGVWLGGDNYKVDYSEDHNNRPATHEEIERHLIQEAKRRGYKGGNTINGIHGTTYKQPEISSFYYDAKYDRLLTDYGCAIYCAGQWAEIVEQPAQVKKESNPIHYNVEGAVYSLDYQELKAKYQAVVNYSDEVFMDNLPEIAHLSCIISYFKGLSNNATIGDKGIVHELIHLMTDPNEPTNNLQEIRKSFNDKIKLV